MALQEPELDLAELCKRTGVTVRTVRYYVQQGLLPSPGTGPHARYSQEHLDRLQLIRKMQREHLPLAEIRRRLDKPRAVERLIREEAREPPPPSNTAADYVRAVLSGGPLPPTPTPTTTTTPTVEAARSTWERISLGVDVELHVRRPQTRFDNRRIERIIEAAQRILNETD